eukprot:SAG31_NODE_25688_length_456_cov_1.154062_1_plen_76_part_10
MSEQFEQTSCSDYYPIDAPCRSFPQDGNAHFVFLTSSFTTVVTASCTLLETTREVVKTLGATEGVTAFEYKSGSKP